MYENAHNLAYDLRLYGIQASLERRCAESQAENLHPSDLVRLLLEDERDRRKQTAAKMLQTKAKFRTSGSLEDWDHTTARGLPKAKLKELALLNFYHKKQNLIIVGKTGVGKTHLGIAIGNRLCQETISTAFYSTNLFFEEAAAVKASGQYLKFIKKLKKVKAIAFDDFALRKYTHEEANILLEILEERYQNGVTIITTQVSPQGWPGLFEDSVICEAICDRLVNPSQTIELTGESYRTKLNTIDHVSNGK